MTINDIQDHTGISRAILTQRLTRLTDEGVVERVPYQGAPPRAQPSRSRRRLSVSSRRRLSR